jgi:hypothetical protein
VTLINGDGNAYQGDTCMAVDYQDILSRGGMDRPAPYVVTTAPFDSGACTVRDSAVVTMRGTQANSVYQWFTGGRDTVQGVLYFAPSHPDSVHQYHGYTGDLHGSTERFRLNAGPLDSIDVIAHTGEVDTVQLDAGGGDIVYLTAQGFDAYGNPLGEVAADWQSGGTLPVISGMRGESQIVYGSQGVNWDRTGPVDAFVVDTAGDTISGSIHVEIQAPRGTIDSAITRDRNGNGYLDHIEIYFSRDIDIHPDSLRALFSTRYHRVVRIDSVIQPDSSNGSYYELVLDEQYNIERNNELQTALEPPLTFDNSAGTISYITPDLIDDIDVRDGAGPVVDSVVVNVDNVNDRTLDRITIVFSEDVRDSSGNYLTTAYSSPEDMFELWQVVGDSTVPVTDVLEYYTIVSTEDNRVVLQHKQDNKPDSGAVKFQTNYMVSLKADTAAGDPVVLRDGRGNPPVPGNEPVDVIIRGPVGGLQVINNPGKPATEVNPVMEYIPYNKLDTTDFSDNGRGVIFRVNLLYDDKLEEISWRAMIYDLAGNLVYHGESDGSIETPDEWNPGSMEHLNTWWSGCNDRNMAVAPGVYRAVLRVTFYYRDKTVKREYIETVGIRR